MVNSVYCSIKNFLVLSFFILVFAINFYLLLLGFQIDNKITCAFLLPLFLLLYICLVAGCFTENSVVFKVLAFFSIVLTFYLSITKIYNSQFFNNFSSVEEFRKFILKYDSKSKIIFVLIQFLQVVILPIPSLVTIGAGVLLFGVLNCALLSSVGIISGSLFSFFVGRIFGSKVASWLLGEEKLNKFIKIFNKKSKVLLPFMFLFPFFPDDLLCFVAGVSKVDCKYFIFTTIIVRAVAIFVSALSFGNLLIPYDTWWGICIYFLFFIFTLFFAKNVLQNENFFLNRILNRRNEK